MSDLISREAALKCFHSWVDKYGDVYTPDEMPEYQAIEALPSAEPERKHGKWIMEDNPGTGWYRVTCSECGENVTSEIPMIGFIPNAKALWDYCPYCGADMRGEQDE